MADIAYFATNHGKGSVLEVRRKLEEINADLITIEDSVYLQLIPFGEMKDGRIKAGGYQLKDRINIMNPYDNRLYYGTDYPDFKGAIIYALDKYPIFFIDTYRKETLDGIIPLSSKTSSVYGLLSSRELVMIDYGLHPSLTPIDIAKDEDPFVRSSNLAMGHNINHLVKQFSPKRVAHFGGRDHYNGNFNSKPLQEIVDIETMLMWDVVTNEPLLSLKLNH